MAMIERYLLSGSGLGWVDAGEVAWHGQFGWRCLVDGVGGGGYELACDGVVGWVVGVDPAGVELVLPGAGGLFCSQPANNVNTLKAMAPEIGLGFMKLRW